MDDILLCLLALLLLQQQQWNQWNGVFLESRLKFVFFDVSHKIGSSLTASINARSNGMISVVDIFFICKKFLEIEYLKKSPFNNKKPD